MERRQAIKSSVAFFGITASSSTLISILQSCQGMERDGWKPRILSQEQMKSITALVDTILPKTDSPGGLDMKVDIFIDQVIGQLMTNENKVSFLTKADAFDAECDDSMGKSFHQLSTDERLTWLQSAEQSDAKFSPSVWGGTVGEQPPVGFYRSVKSMMLWGYFSSEVIGKKWLNYDPVPGGYQGCIPLKDIGNSWSL